MVSALNLLTLSSMIADKNPLRIKLQSVSVTNRRLQRNCLNILFIGPSRMYGCINPLKLSLVIPHSSNETSCLQMIHLFKDHFPHCVFKKGTGNRTETKWDERNAMTIPIDHFVVHHQTGATTSSSPH